MSGYTKGPWRVSTKPDVMFIHGAGALFIADLVNNHNPEQEANARLIAAAPELLEALKGAQEELRLIRMKDTNAVYNPTIRILMELAIAKAEGL